MTPVAPRVAERAYHHGDLRRALVEAALSLMADQQNWDFSLRQVARRAGVSHNAPYNHFADKRMLLAAIAVAGFDDLATRTAEAVAAEVTPEGALRASGVAYCRFGLAHPALYRLMFGSTLKGADDAMPDSVFHAAGAAKAVLERVIREGADTGRFALSAENEGAVDRAVLAAWSLVHGLTMLLIDRLPGEAVMVQPEPIVAAIIRTLLDGLACR